MNGELCEKLSVFCTALFGIVTASATLGMGGMALGVAGAALSLPAAVGLLRRRREDAPSIVRDVARDVGKGWRDWIGSGGEWTKNDLDQATMAMSKVLDLLDPDPGFIIKHGRNNAVVADELIRLARERAPHLYAGHLANGAPNPDAAHADKNSTFLKSMLTGTLSRLEGNPAHEAAILPWFQRAVLRHGEVGDDTNARLREVQAQQARTNELLGQLLASGDTRRAEQAGVRPEALMGLARRISADIQDLDQAFRELESAVDIAIEVQAEGRRGSNAGEFVDRVLARMAELSARGEYREAQAEADRAFALWERSEAERRDDERQRGLKLLDAGVKQDLLLRDAASAAVRIVRTVELRTEPSEVFDAIRAVQDEWYVRGRDKGLNLDLAVSIEIARVALDRADNADRRGAALNDLGNALSILGERESGTARLREAIEAYRAALEERTREHVPLQWAMTQNNLGVALQTLGERESGAARLEEAVEAYRAALEEFTRERAPLQWAATQNNLGNALQAFGRRESGTARLEQAVDAYRAAMEERTRERAPLDWAATQNNLGNTLSILGGRESDAARLKQAVEAYRAALEEWTRERVPLQWAMTQNNLGDTLTILGRRESGTSRLEEAVEACRTALEERTRERAPFFWAQTRENEARARLALFEKTAEADLLDEALAAVDGALEVYRAAKADYDVGRAESLRARIIAARGKPPAT